MEGKLKKSKGPNTHSVWWCYIVAILLILIYLLPIYIMLNLSFRTLQDLGTKLSLPAAWNFGNYVEVFKSGDLWLGFKNSIILVVETVTLEIVLSALAAYGLARSSGRLAESIRNINMGIMMIPSVALLVGTYGLMVKFHMTNTLYGLALLSAAGGIPGTMFMYVNFVVSIPTALDEAAAIDGAGVLRTFTQIIMPQLKAVTVTRIIMSATGCCPCICCRINPNLQLSWLSNQPSTERTASAICRRPVLPVRWAFCRSSCCICSCRNILLKDRLTAL